MLPLVLASTSPYRRALLDRFGLPYRVATPQVSEERLDGESATALVKRLAEAKARSVSQSVFDSQSVSEKNPAVGHALIIGSDQVAVLNQQTKDANTHAHPGIILGKPGHYRGAREQLRQLSGHQVDFFTGISLYNTLTDHAHIEVVAYHVQFRRLNDAMIERYLHKEQPYDCAGSFKSEGLGIALFERMAGDDPTALIGLPLIALRRLLQQENVEII